jgi:TRAP-type C4-dicarboxylate transport system permease small subunit
LGHQYGGPIMPEFSRIDAFFGRLYDHIATLVGVTIGLFAICISLDLVLRLAHLGNLPGVQELIEYALYAGVFLAAPWVLRLGAHVRVDLVLGALPAPLSRLLDRSLDLLGMVICLVLLRYGWANLSQAYQFQSMQMKYFVVPEWWLLVVFVISFLLLALEFLFRFLRGGDLHRIDDLDVGGL